MPTMSSPSSLAMASSPGMVNVTPTESLEQPYKGLTQIYLIWMLWAGVVGAMRSEVLTNQLDVEQKAREKEVCVNKLVRQDIM